MALGDPYVTTDELGVYLGADLADIGGLLSAACSAASEWVNQHCQRQFNNTVTATARAFKSRDCGTVEVDDFHTTTDLVIKTDTTDDGTYDTTWTTADYVLEPFDGIEAGMTGFPYRTIRAVESLQFPARTYRPRVQVTAQWGWAAVPASVTDATRIVAAFLYNLKDSPLGVASFTDAGLIRVRDIPQAAMLLKDYAHPSNTGPLVA
jgi:hypothetical protein